MADQTVNGTAAPTTRRAMLDSNGLSPEGKRYFLQFQHITGFLSGFMLLLGLTVWMFKPGQHRLALLILVCAMFLSILHYYSLEDLKQGNPSTETVAPEPDPA